VILAGRFKAFDMRAKYSAITTCAISRRLRRRPRASASRTPRDLRQINVQKLEGGVASDAI